MGNIKLRRFAEQKKKSRKQKRSLQNGRKYLQTMHLIGSQYPKYIKNTFKSIPEKIKFKIGQRNR